jgi:hypothetical protein
MKTLKMGVSLGKMWGFCLKMSKTMKKSPGFIKLFCAWKSCDLRLKIFFKLALVIFKIQ